MGSFASGASSYGVLDLAGNVEEFVSDRYDSSYYHAAPDTNPAGPAGGAQRVVRGGGFQLSHLAYQCYWRGRIDPGAIRLDCGFRVAQ